jgi:hypothetical protein
VVDEFRQMAAVGERLGVREYASVEDRAPSGVTSAVIVELAWIVPGRAAGKKSCCRVRTFIRGAKYQSDDDGGDDDADDDTTDGHAERGLAKTTGLFVVSVLGAVGNHCIQNVYSSAVRLHQL